MSYFYHFSITYTVDGERYFDSGSVELSMPITNEAGLGQIKEKVFELKGNDFTLLSISLLSVNNGVVHG